MYHSHSAVLHGGPGLSNESMNDSGILGDINNDKTPGSNSNSMLMQ